MQIGNYKAGDEVTERRTKVKDGSCRGDLEERRRRRRTKELKLGHALARVRKVRLGYIWYDYTFGGDGVTEQRTSVKRQVV